MWKHSQLQTEGDTQHLKSFHLEVHSNGGLIILIKGVFAEPINEASLSHRQVPHHNDLGDLKSAGHKSGQGEWARALSP